jgi:hypothetical protein
LAQSLGCQYGAATIGRCGKPVKIGRRYCEHHKRHEPPEWLRSHSPPEREEQPDDGPLPPCECGHLTDRAMGYPPDAKAARESLGPHHTPIRCCWYRKTNEPAPLRSERA